MSLYARHFPGLLSIVNLPGHSAHGHSTRKSAAETQASRHRDVSQVRSQCDDALANMVRPLVRHRCLSKADTFNRSKSLDRSQSSMVVVVCARSFVLTMASTGDRFGSVMVRVAVLMPCIQGAVLSHLVGFDLEKWYLLVNNLGRCQPEGVVDARLGHT